MGTFCKLFSDTSQKQIRRPWSVCIYICTMTYFQNSKHIKYGKVLKTQELSGK